MREKLKDVKINGKIIQKGNSGLQEVNVANW